MSEQIVAEARRWLGTPYRHQGSRLGAGCDCLGLIRGIWRALYGREAGVVPPYGVDGRDPGSSAALEEAAQRYLVRKDGEPQAGDVILFRLVRGLPPRHCGVMVSGDSFIHAQEQVGVVEAHLSESWARRVAGVFGFPST